MNTCGSDVSVVDDHYAGTCLYTYMYVCIHIYIYIHIHIHIHIYMNTWAIDVSVLNDHYAGHISTYTHIYRRTTYIDVHTQISTYIHTRTYIAHISIHTRTYIHVHTYTFIHIHIHRNENICRSWVRTPYSVCANIHLKLLSQTSRLQVLGSNPVLCLCKHSFKNYCHKRHVCRSWVRIPLCGAVRVCGAWPKSLMACSGMH